MTNRRMLVAITFIVVGWLTSVGGAWGQGAGSAVAVSDVWPREFKLPNATLLVYQPQINSWQGNGLDFRAVVRAKPAGKEEETYGVIWGTARTQVDRVARMVTLEDLVLTKSHFPMLPDNGAAYLKALQAQVGATAVRTIALDRLEASLAASGTVKATVVPVNTEPPRILVSYTPALLVSIDGPAVVRPVPNTRFERVINTHALILREMGSTTFYLHVYDGWLYAGTVDGPWYQPMIIPPGIDQVAGNLAKAGIVDLIDGGNVKPKPSLARGVPTINVSHTPTELLVFNGSVNFAPIEGTSLHWASNTANDVFWDSADRRYYVLISGRWYRGLAITGPWVYVASTDLPADFRKIPTASPASVVLASVAGTPQAEEALISNSIPQTATVPRANGPKFTPVFDGAPQLKPIDGTPLEYVANTPVPIIRVDASTFYSLQAGVWFYATTLNGAWYVAPSVPSVIYTIPVTSPLHYVTYVHVYGSTAQVVYVGYTPGYLGTVVAPGGVVVYGTGYVYQPWIGTAWYPPPVTYGVMAQPVYNPAVGFTFGFAMGVSAASAAYAWGAVPYYHPAYYGYPCCGSASANVYGQYGHTAYSGTRTWYNNPGGSYGTSTSGTYHNYATGTSGSYSGYRSYNPYTGQAQAGYGRTFNTPSGVSGSVNRNASWNPQSGTLSASSSASATGPGGRSTSVQGSRSESASGQASGSFDRTTSNANTGISRTTETTAGTGQAPSRTTTVSDSKTGQSKTFGSGEAYADHNGNVYKNSESGWQQHTSSGWQSASSSSSSWADKEQQARSQGEEKYNSFKESGGTSAWSGKSGGGGGGWGGGDWGSRSGGGWSSHAEGGGDFASRFSGGGGGLGGRFGGGGWGGGGRFGGRR